MSLEMLLAQADAVLAQCNDLITRIEASYIYMLNDTELAMTLDRPEWAQRNNDAALAAL